MKNEFIEIRKMMMLKKYDQDMMNKLIACVRYFSLSLKGKCISSLYTVVQMKYIEKKFTLKMLFLPTVSWTFILSSATTRYQPPWNFLFRKSNCSYMCVFTG